MSTGTRDSVFFNMFYRVVRDRPSAIFMTQPLGEGRIRDFTFAQAMNEAKRMAAHLRSLGLPRGSQIALASKNCAHFILADIAIWMTGHVSVAIYPTMNSEEVRYILEDSEAKLLFVGKLDAPAWDRMKAGVPQGLPRIAFPQAPVNDLPSWDDIIAANAPIADEPQVDPEDRAAIIYTSGSSGRPKGVIHTFASCSVAVHTMSKAVNASSESRWLSFLPLAHTMERLAGETHSLAVGFHVFFTESLDTFIEDLKRARPTHFAAVPRLLSKLRSGVFAKVPERKLKRLLRIPIVSRFVKKKIRVNLGLDAVMVCVSGAAPLTEALFTWYRGLGLHFCEAYGMTENFSLSHLGMPENHRVGYVGLPYEGVICRISDEGEILVKSPAVMAGYNKLPDETEAAFTDDGFLKTGDLGEISPEAYLRITGRIKDVFKTDRGKYVTPMPIENVLDANDAVEMSCVGGAGQTEAHAILQLSDDLHLRRDDPALRAEVTPALEELLGRVNQGLASHERLAFLVVAKDAWTPESGLITPTMKLKRQAIEGHYRSRLDAWYAAGRKVIWE